MRASYSYGKMRLLEVTLIIAVMIRITTSTTTIVTTVQTTTAQGTTTTDIETTEHIPQLGYAEVVPSGEVVAAENQTSLEVICWVRRTEVIPTTILATEAKLVRKAAESIGESQLQEGTFDVTVEWVVDLTQFWEDNMSQLDIVVLVSYILEGADEWPYSSYEIQVRREQAVVHSPIIEDSLDGGIIAAIVICTCLLVVIIIALLGLGIKRYRDKKVLHHETDSSSVPIQPDNPSNNSRVVNNIERANILISNVDQVSERSFVPPPLQVAVKAYPNNNSGSNNNSFTSNRTDRHRRAKSSNNNARNRRNNNGRNLSFIFPLETKMLSGSMGALDNISVQLNETSEMDAISLAKGFTISCAAASASTDSLSALGASGGEEWERQVGWIERLPKVGTCVAVSQFDPTGFGDSMSGLLEVPATGRRLSVLQWDLGSGWTCVRADDGTPGFVPTNILAMVDRE